MQHNRSTVNTPATSRPVTPGPESSKEKEAAIPPTPAPAALGISTPLMPYSGIHTPAPTRAVQAAAIVEGLSRSESDASLPAYSASDTAAPPTDEKVEAERDSKLDDNKE